MIFLFLILGFFLLYIYCVPFRLILSNPFKVIYYIFKDCFNYFKHRDFDKFEGGSLNCYTAHFGGGKTLSAVTHIYSLYKRYNNRRVWDSERKKFVLQKVLVLSNVDFTGDINYQPLDSLSRVVECQNFNKLLDEKNNTRTVTLVLIDEASVMLNSRSFKDNIDPIFLNTLLCSRHCLTSIFYTSQKFSLSDKLLRNVTQRVIECRKVWRFVLHYTYSADDVEIAGSTSVLRPLDRNGFFVTDKLFNLYDTYAYVSQLKKDCKNGDMMTEEEIISSRGDFYNQELNPRHKKRFKR